MDQNIEPDVRFRKKKRGVLVAAVAVLLLAVAVWGMRATLKGSIRKNEITLNADKGYMGNYGAIVLAKDASDIPKMKKEYADIVAKLPIPGKEWDHVYSHADTYVEGYVRTGNEKSSGMTYAFIAITLFALFVMLLPTLNLVNVNITRIMERSSEIGVRKAFGASSKPSFTSYCRKSYPHLPGWNDRRSAINSGYVFY